MNYVEIELGGKTRKLKFDYNALCEVEAKAGKSVIQLMSADNLGFGAVRALLYGGLIWQDRGLTMDRLGQMLSEYMSNGGSLGDLMAKISEALNASGLFGKPMQSDEAGDESGGNVEGVLN
ncbi:MAG: hypothetical protein H6Q73_924 [Firmicutes bacterium]|nr:hypothetical protein [Bacillota bacterium]